ncbi:MAG: helix-turn-helix transcriptional regulator [Firmicutes bacterium]|nr:helix-turn-helix transcriptional regulator [Bacillota bacterium]
MPNLEKQLRYMEYVQREAGVRHQSTEEDNRIWELIKAGDLRSVDALRYNMEHHLAGTTSKDPLRNAKYILVAVCTLAGRAAMSAGMEPERSNTASDLFIQRADVMDDIEQIDQLMIEVVRFYTMEVAALDKKSVFSLNVSRALDYIYLHLHEPITVEEVANAVGISRGYFSSLFKQELGIGVAEYILSKRMEAARNMLRYSDMSYAEISQVLAFSSQSHFIAVFKKANGCTPKEYRMREAQ